MLGQRVITAVLLLALLLPALASGQAWPLALLVALMVGAAGWEWGRLNGLASLPALGLAALVVGLLALLALGWSSQLAATSQPLPAAAGGWAAGWWWVVMAWVAGGAAALRMGSAGWARMAAPLRWVLGLMLLVAGGAAILQARRLGLNFLLSAMALVWAADIAAYFVGRALGRRKLAPQISPGKSWEGALGGLAGVLLLGLLWMQIDALQADAGAAWVDSPSLFTALQQRGGWALWLMASIGLAALSVVGDLFESLVKRAAGAKDSSRLLPGHGGVLDRIDALLPVLPAALALVGA